MRPIKFRAWDKEKNAMLLIFDSESQTEWFLPNVKKRYAVMQFTGLLDKNGKEIYEGDIVDLTLHVSPYENCDDDEKSHPVIRTVARFESGSFWLTGGGYDICTHFHHDDEDREIVGNVYENPELLK